jgi:hypothetical protein
VFTPMEVTAPLRQLEHKAFSADAQDSSLRINFLGRSLREAAQAPHGESPARKAALLGNHPLCRGRWMVHGKAPMKSC